MTPEKPPGWADMMKTITVQHSPAEAGSTSTIQNKKIGKQYYTKFTWLLSDYSSNYQETYSRGVESDSFVLNGIDKCTCQLSINPGDRMNPVAIQFSDTVLIQAVKMVISIQYTHKFECYYVQPVPRIIHVSGIIESNKQAKLNDLLTCDSVRGIGSELNFSVSFSVTKFAKPHIQLFRRPRKNLVGSMKSVFEDKICCDITFVLGNKRIPAHKAILVAQSKVFEAMFLSAMKEKRTSRVDIVDTSAEIFEEFLKYLYTGEIKDLTKIVEQVLAVADKYQVGDLKELCENCLLGNLCRDTVVKYVLIADKYRCTLLKKKALEILRNSGSVLTEAIKNENLETLMRLKEMLCNESLKDQ